MTEVCGVKGDHVYYCIFIVIVQLPGKCRVGEVTRTCAVRRALRRVTALARTVLHRRLSFERASCCNGLQTTSRTRSFPRSAGDGGGQLRGGGS
ncbi:hypothetical protein EVAR_24115_1 [Eumeta japonica]|uniref:Uncharacterized protein n=1 Tax=Eumeta variegata TaxID=151549 RepID=A0A4C1YMM6_EUMVA|nr:hypothetical protein EVAR_24115_1 [Eumeta japonica]